MVVSEMQPLQIVAFNLRYLSDVELKRIKEHSSSLRLALTLKGEREPPKATTTTGSKLLLSIVSYLPKLTIIELAEVEEHARRLVKTISLQQPHHTQTQSNSKSDESKLMPSNVPRPATPTKLDETTDWPHSALKVLNTAFKTHLAKEPLDEDWTVVMHSYIEQAATVRQVSHVSNVPSRATPMKSNEATDWQRRAFNALNTELKSHLAKEPLDQDWTIIVDSYIEQATVKIRPACPFRLMDLPVEIRHLIYELVVTPEMAEAHVKKNKIPTLFQISHNMSSDFAAFYYSLKVFKVELLDPSTLSWEVVVNPVKVQAMFEQWIGCAVYDNLSLITHIKAYAELEIDSFSKTFAQGVISWIGGPKGMGVECTFSVFAQPRGRGARMERMARKEARVAQRRRIAELLRSTDSSY